jgi:hypothetical protein
MQSWPWIAERRVSKDALTAIQPAEWIDLVTDARMEGFGTEILKVKDGLFNEWIASFSVWRHGLVKIPGAKHQGGEA